MIGKIVRRISAWARTTIRQAGHHALETAVLAIVTGCVVATIIFTVQAGSDVAARRDLGFNGATREIEALLTDQGPASLIRSTSAAAPSPDPAARADTLRIVADSAQYPGFAKGGFLADQVRAFNDFAVIAAQYPASVLGTSNPSLFRVERDDTGGVEVSRTLNPYTLLVRSPFAEGAWRTVRALDYGRGPALIGVRDEVGLDHHASTTPSLQTLNGRECLVQSGGRDSLMFYCTSQADAGVHRFFDLAYIPTGITSGVSGRVSRYRPGKMWLNGLSVVTPQFVTRGDMIESAPLGPLLLSSRDHGVLADNQWVNGRISFTTAAPGTLALFGRAGRSPTTAVDAGQPLQLALDQGLSTDLEREVRRYAADNADLIERMAVVVLDLRSGGIRAIAETDSRGGSLLSFEPLLMGSMVKPILAAAILSRQPDLARLVVQYSGDLVNNVDGINLSRPFKNELHGCSTTTITFALFLQCSSNQYAAELVMHAIMATPGAAAARSSGVVPVDVLGRSSLALGLAANFDVDVAAKRSAGRLDRYWAANSSDTARVELVGDRSLVPWESRPWMIFPDSATTAVDWLARYAFGGWENRWTLLGVAEAFGRIATDQKIMASFLLSPLPTSFALVDTTSAAGFRTVRDGLLRVATAGTAKGLADAVAKQIPDDPQLRVLAKTGTMNELAARVFLKSLAMVIGRPRSADNTAAMSCGLVAVSYFEFRRDWRALRQAQADNLPNLHTDFAKGGELATLARHWTRLSPC